MTARHPLIEPLIQDLHAKGRLRVWSLVVTILGDVVQPRGGAISMSDLLSLTDHMHIDSGTVRTALSRLSTEKWVVAKRTGRTSSYSFGSMGLENFGPASERIYVGIGQTITDDKWVLAILPPARAKERLALKEVLHQTKAFQSDAGFALWPKAYAPLGETLSKLDCLCFVGALSNIPNWIKTELASPEIESLFKKFISKFSMLREVPDDMPPLDAMVARILLIHDWRRLILRYKPVPNALQPTQWSMPQAHELVVEAYKVLVQTSEQHWPKPLPDTGQAILTQRFESPANPNT